MKIVVLDKENFVGDFPLLPFKNDWVEFAYTPPSELVNRLIDAEVAITNRAILSNDVLTKLPALKLICMNSTGYDTVDASACSRLGITLCNVRDWCTNSVAEQVLAFIFALKRNTIRYDSAIRKGDWKAKAKGSFAILFPPQKEISGSTMGIIGYGTLGRHLEKKAENLGMTVMVAERKDALKIRDGYTAFDDVIKNADIVVMLSPLNESSYKMISRRELTMMKDDALLINCGRGGLIDEKALLESLQDNQIGGAALDVLEHEPPENDNLLLNYNGGNLILSSHIAFASQESFRNNTEQIVGNIIAYKEGKPRNIVNNV